MAYLLELSIIYQLADYSFALKVSACKRGKNMWTYLVFVGGGWRRGCPTVPGMKRVAYTAQLGDCQLGSPCVFTFWGSHRKSTTGSGLIQKSFSLNVQGQGAGKLGVSWGPLLGRGPSRHVRSVVFSVCPSVCISLTSQTGERPTRNPL